MITLQPVAPTAERWGPALLRLQRAAYAVEAGLIGDDRIPALTEQLDELLAAGLTWLVAVEDGRLLGAVGWSRSPDPADPADPAAATAATGLTDIDRLVVDPVAHRRGIGRALVEAVLQQAAGARVLVCTGRANHPARLLYQRLGFRPTGDVQVLPGLWVTRFEHRG